MRIGVIVPMTRLDDTGQLSTWPEVRAYAQHAEAVGVDSVWVFDHLYSGHGDVPPDDIHEAWTLLGALAAVTDRVELGELVTCMAFRSPGLLAKMAVTVDEISAGRLTLGVGAGWYDAEYDAFGYPTDRRGGRFAEALEILVPLLRGETVTFEGRHHRADGAVLLPPPARRIPLLIGGFRPRMLRLTARYADAWNTAWYPHPNALLDQRLADLRTALDAEGRDPATLRTTVGMTAPQTDAGELARAIDAFAALGVDDLIVMQTRKNPAALDLLAEALSLR
ncbi:LLM class flavin-dependent oxidoreductase [Longispora sp. K20-0274]|uniref:TIGR03619 family F420-dependent LLM class oxidoreductase n=1 Tax=Longispora sp. K20-0274 TaxID=3088255 RepID=UPI0039998D95